MGWIIVPTNVTTGSIIVPAGATTVTTTTTTTGANTAVATTVTLPEGFVSWLRQMHAETMGSAQDAYAKVAARLLIELDAS